MQGKGQAAFFPLSFYARFTYSIFPLKVFMHLLCCVFYLSFYIINVLGEGEVELSVTNVSLRGTPEAALSYNWSVFIL